MKKIALAMTLLLLGSGGAYAFSPSPASTPGTRVVPVIRNVPKEAVRPNVKAANVKAADGKAELSRYVTPEFDKTLGTEAALTWVFGVLGGNREYMYAAPDIFKTGADEPALDRVTGFLTLREQLYPATAWSVGNGQLLGVEKEHFGYKVKVLGVNLEPLKETSFKQVTAKYPKLSEDARRVLAEWHVMYKLRDEDEIAKLRHTEIVKAAPVNAFGKIAFGNDSVNKLFKTPEKIIIEIAGAMKKTPKWAEPYMDSLKFIVSYSANAYFSPELKNALK